MLIFLILRGKLEIDNNFILSKDQLERFDNDGVLVVPSFYDLEAEIEPIQRQIHSIIGFLIKKHGLPIHQAPFSPEQFDSGYQELIQHDRRIGGTIYDAVKQIPAFHRLVGCTKHGNLLKQIRHSDNPGVAAGGYGIRIDNPFEEKFKAPWHQDYTAQFKSIDGLVFWSPLVQVNEQLGPVKFCLGSHKDGLVRVHTKDPRDPNKSGAYALILEDEENRVSRYKHASPLTNPGDLVIIDFLTLHASGSNISTRSRWSMQIRYFNYEDPTGIGYDWVGGYASGKTVKDIHPELVID